MPDPATIQALAGFAPLTGVAYGPLGAQPTAVDVDHPLPVASGAPASPASVTIASGANLSDAIDLGAQRLHRIVTPAAWTAAAISFQGSADGTNFADLWSADAEVAIASATVPTAAARTIVVDQAVFYGIRWLKLRSGTSAAGVNQAADRTIGLVTVPR